MRNVTPHYLEARLRNAVGGVRKLVHSRGLERVFEAEVFSLELHAQEALESGMRGLVEHALEEVRLLEAEIHRVPAQASARASSSPVGRAGRGPARGE